MDAVDRAIPGPQIEIIVDRRALRQIFLDRPPLAAGRQDIHQSVDDLAQSDAPFAAPGRTLRGFSNPPSAGSLADRRAEGTVRAPKENLLWVRVFETVEEFRQALLEFRDPYNETRLLERHGFLSPNAVCAGALSNVARAA
ncbi:hypothetical protein AA12717_2034 [Gluconacetobacter sacchari DSM 12717]|uniref:Uncharacterized protein n=1 Tax=Gluconacetobacter sacchari DSM 12717 TaxID=1307940 RepID=A0ABQ0P7B6_9PROT|nr:hypothetical protein AA12717_2034 [Gluconacetobacter sacchari DSM 12717]